MLVPFQTYMALTQLKQQQQQATPTSSSSEKDKEVVQLDGTFPELSVDGMKCGSKVKKASPFRSSGVGNGSGIGQLDGASGGQVESSSDDDSDLDEDSSEVSRHALVIVLTPLAARVPL